MFSYRVRRGLLLCYIAFKSAIGIKHAADYMSHWARVPFVGEAGWFYVKANQTVEDLGEEETKDR
jgi:hypothetical protein